MSNSTTRILTDYEKTKQAELLKDILSNIKKKENIPGRTREIIADILNTSPTNIARMESISKKLTPELKKEFEKENIGITKAYELSRKTEEEQKEALEEYKESKEKTSSPKETSIKSEKKKHEEKKELPIEELKRLAEIGRATEKAFKHNGIIETRFFHDGELFLEDRFESIEELLEWYESEGK